MAKESFVGHQVVSIVEAISTILKLAMEKCIGQMAVSIGDNGREEFKMVSEL